MFIVRKFLVRKHERQRNAPVRKRAAHTPALRSTTRLS